MEVWPCGDLEAWSCGGVGALPCGEAWPCGNLRHWHVEMYLLHVEAWRLKELEGAVSQQVEFSQQHHLCSGGETPPGLEESVFFQSLNPKVSVDLLTQMSPLRDFNEALRA